VTPAVPKGPRADLISDKGSDSRSSPRYAPSDRYPRERSRDRRFEGDNFTDGSYGFEDRMETDVMESNDGRGRGGLYSDSMVSRRGDRGRRGASRERGRGGDRSRGFK
jgi:hypothetical protein